jgi:hypothetical protein
MIIFIYIWYLFQAFYTVLVLWVFMYSFNLIIINLKYIINLNYKLSLQINNSILSVRNLSNLNECKQIKWKTTDVYLFY